MQKRNLGLAALLIVLSIGGAEAGQIAVTAGAPGLLTPSNGSTQLLTFNALPNGPLPSFAFSGGSLSGNGAVENTTTGTFARPAGDTTPYLTVAGSRASGETTIRLTAPTSYFGLYWGSIDPYNFIEFLRNGQEIAEFSGSNVASLAGLTANGDQQSNASNRYINFNLDSALYDQVVLSTTNFAFEVDNIAIGAPVHIPEPATALLLAAWLFAIAAARRRPLA